MADPGTARLRGGGRGGGGGEEEEEEGEERAAAAAAGLLPEAAGADPPAPVLFPWALSAMSKRRTWVVLFLIAYAALISASWRILLAVRAWYDAAAHSAAAPWPALYASALLGGVFGLLSMAAALAVALPAMLTAWITLLVLLAFAGKPRRALLREGRRATADIAGFALKVLVREGNLVAAVCALVSFVALLRRREDVAAGST